LLSQQANKWAKNLIIKAMTSRLLLDSLFPEILESNSDCEKQKQSHLSLKSNCKSGEWDPDETDRYAFDMNFDFELSTPSENID
jgi:hypothetical protein